MTVNEELLKEKVEVNAAWRIIMIWKLSSDHCKNKCRGVQHGDNG